MALRNNEEELKLLKGHKVRSDREIAKLNKTVKAKNELLLTVRNLQEDTQK